MHTRDKSYYFRNIENGYILNQISGIDTEKHITTFARNGNVFSGGVMQFVNLSNTFHKFFLKTLIYRMLFLFYKQCREKKKKQSITFFTNLGRILPIRIFPLSLSNVIIRCPIIFKIRNITIQVAMILFILRL